MAGIPSLINRGSLPPVVEDELEQYAMKMKGLWLVEHKEDGTHQPLSIDASEIDSGTLDAGRIPDLDASKITSGTVADARLPSELAYEDEANVFTQDQRINAGLGVNVAPGAAGTISASGAVYERGRSTAMGEWTDVAYDAGNFTAKGSMTWTAENADQVSYKWTLLGKTMIVSFTLNSTSVGGTASDELRIAIPGGYLARNSDTLGAIRAYDNGTDTVGFCGVVAGAGYIRCWRGGFSNWALSTNNTSVQGQAVFEIQ